MWLLYVNRIGRVTRNADSFFLSSLFILKHSNFIVLFLFLLLLLLLRFIFFHSDSFVMFITFTWNSVLKHCLIWSWKCLIVCYAHTLIFTHPYKYTPVYTYTVGWQNLRETKTPDNIVYVYTMMIQNPHNTHEYTRTRSVFVIAGRDGIHGLLNQYD